jgi:hypothetical protein
MTCPVSKTTREMNSFALAFLKLRRSIFKQRPDWAAVRPGLAAFLVPGC